MFSNNFFFSVLMISGLISNIPHRDIWPEELTFQMPNSKYKNKISQ